MAYYIRCNRFTLAGIPQSANPTLVECKREPDDCERYYYTPIDGQSAHRWVRQDGHHETPLYIDADNRIRYARDA